MENFIFYIFSRSIGVWVLPQKKLNVDKGENMKKYRLGYDECLVASPIISKNNIIIGLSLIIKYKLYDIKTDVEILFNKKDQSIGKQISSFFDNGNSTYADLKEIYLNDFLVCSFNKTKDNYLDFKLVNLKKLKQMGFRLEYEIESFYKDILVDFKTDRIILEEEYNILNKNNNFIPCGKPEKITEEEFYNIIKNNIENFDNYDNQITQSTSYKLFLVK